MSGTARACLLAVSIGAAAPPPLDAQRAVVVDFAVGAGGGPRRPVDMGGFALDFGAGIRSALPRGDWSLAVATAAEGWGPHGDRCRIIPFPDGPCYGPMTMRGTALLLGAGTRVGPVALGASAGPGWFTTNHDISTGGVQARADAALPARSRMALLLTARRSWLAEAHDIRWHPVTAVTLGVRIRVNGGGG